MIMITCYMWQKYGTMQTLFWSVIFSIISFFETTWLTIVLDEIVGYYFPEWEVLRTQIWRQNLKFHDTPDIPMYTRVTKFVTSNPEAVELKSVMSKFQPTE